jgi:hypothetical protein
MVRRLQPTLEEAELGVKNGNSAALVYSKSGLESSGATCQSEALLVKVRSKESDPHCSTRFSTRLYIGRNYKEPEINTNLMYLRTGEQVEIP